MKLDTVAINIEGGLECAMPKMVHLEQRFRSDKVDNITETLHASMAQFDGADFKGKKIAVTAGSRGITGIQETLKATIAKLKEWGAEPFIVPAMGSHGGATAAGQRKVLEEYDITEETMGVPIKASMEVIEITKLEDGTPVYFDKMASEADGIVVCARVKPHTDFRGDYESGLFKMMAIGLGKQHGAMTIHKHGFCEFHWLIPAMGHAMMDKMPIVMGVAIVENGYHNVMAVEAIKPADFDAREKFLLQESKDALAKLLMEEIDVLIVDEIGKNISGAGMDPNVTGIGTAKFVDFGGPKLQKLFVRDLTDESNGNACGVGFADLIPMRMANKIDFGYTYTNSITSTELLPSRLPIVLNNDKDCLSVALMCCNKVAPADAKIVRIKNTNELTHIWVSEAVLEDLKGRDDVAVLGDPVDIKFDADGYMVD